MTLEQLRIFVAVAEREHVTRAAEMLNVTQSAASGAIASLEARHDIKLFHRVGRGIELTDAGQMFLHEARAVLARAASAELALSEYGGLKRGNLRLVASQTIAGYWLPERLAAFHARYPQIELSVALANTEGAARCVLDGEAELGFIEGSIDEPGLAHWKIGTDRMLLVGRAPADAITNAWIREAPWVMRERGSGTRSTFEDAVRARDIDPRDLNVVLTLPSNEAVLAAVRAGVGHAVLSHLVVAPAIEARALFALPFDLAERPFFGLRQKERYRSKAADALLDVIKSFGGPFDWII
ncbi:LysR substrate-binding domain-containing protein [Novosphingobium sp. Fuku2-ISO-50]|jgi:DNA-binding transcriptional LysR family regulator|uniref:LysR substrate-binding domain-containing protein n=1 Tax=Novosphingobium sp. Fuku2-ISO-50 TaxID=1739114 RepID=UPI00076D5229|nr:LysR substrate-binding domain-containing protein [Novosphingobium sp. Fuku2-ISO-50]KUR77553.1 LysR family transcriptional regulator [Novosphingobium sp. Fuku2-ISO-50]